MYLFERILDPDEGEVLYRRLKPNCVNSDGDVVNIPGPTLAVDLPRCSVERARCSGPPSEMAAKKPGFPFVAQITPSDLPPTFTHHSSNDLYEPVILHCPEDGVAAHAEIRIRKVGATEWSTPSKAFRSSIRDEICRRMRVVR